MDDGPFRNRQEAGQTLADSLRHHAGREDVGVLALPRGGVPVAFEIARALEAELDVFLRRKLVVPGHEELAMGAIASGGIQVMNRQVVDRLRLSEATVAAAVQQEREELQRRERQYRGGRPPISVRDRTVIVVDDGLATGASMRAAVEALRLQRPRWLAVAVPVAAAEACDELRKAVDEVVCVRTPAPFNSVGEWYVDFDQTGDEEVRALLARAQRERKEPSQPPR